VLLFLDNVLTKIRQEL